MPAYICCHQNADLPVYLSNYVQWCLFALCGFGYLLDLAFAQLFGLIITPLQAELGVPNGSLGEQAAPAWPETLLPILTHLCALVLNR